ncbi:MAG: hypothetical protein IJ538_03925 [Clostridia bacterium]|nr:hypothetical protein [Clostridia bacterium]
MDKNYVVIDKRSTFIDSSVKLGKNVIIYENNRIEGNTVIGDNVTIFPNSFISNSIIAKGSKIYSSFIENSSVGECCLIGPFAHLRTGSNLEGHVKVGNFCEIKNSHIGKGTKVSHLAYVGDANIGEGCNIGCGTIFVNYNGKIKQRSNVGNNVFIGSNSNIIAPVEIKSNSYICAGTTIDKNVDELDFVIGRVRQESKKGRAKEYLDEIK